MNPIIKNILVFVAALLIGGSLNMMIILISGSIIPPPEGVDVTTMEGLKKGMHLFEPKHFLMPFLAHALGTLLGAFLTFKFASSHNMLLAMGIGLCFLVGGIMNIFMLPSPLWFTLVDLIVAYIPMAYLGTRLMKRK